MVGWNSPYLITLEKDFINELRLMQNIDLQTAEATLNQRVTKGISLSMATLLRIIAVGLIGKMTLKFVCEQ